MSRMIDITGMRSGALTVVRSTEKRRRGSVMWLCRCDCGRELLVETYKIRSGIIKSCGCARTQGRIRDLRGQRFGRLTAMYRLKEKRSNCYLWHCRCDCGNELDIPVNSLTSGNTQSCGCARTDALRQRARDIRGQKFGLLTAVEPLERRFHGSVVWRCRCSCGRECEVSYNALVSGNTGSCGCLKREHPQPPLHYVEGTCIEMIDRKKLRANNTSGCTGVIGLKSGRWRAEITFRGQRTYLGSYDNYEEAVAARKEAEKQLFRSFLDRYYQSSRDTGKWMYPAAVPEGSSTAIAEEPVPYDAEWKEGTDDGVKED